MERWHKAVRSLLLASMACPWGASEAAEPVADAERLPRLQPTELEQVMGTFEVKEGFELELAAGEPLVVDPVAMDFDASGRAYVVEMIGYSERRPERLGRIRFLSDEDQDGAFDQSSVFARDLPWPTAVICYDGGVFVGATPDVFYLKDTDGDGIADVRRRVLTGFAADSAPYRVDQLNMQAMLNSFRWGPDNRIHGATGLAGGRVYSPMVPGQQPVNLRGRDFSFDPRSLDVRPESGGAQNGMSFDANGEKFVCSNSDHLQHVVYDDVYAGINPLAPSRLARISIAEDGPAAPVFRISPDEPWRVIRTKWRVAGAVRGPVEVGGLLPDTSQERPEQPSLRGMHGGTNTLATHSPLIAGVIWFIVNNSFETVTPGPHAGLRRSWGPSLCGHRIIGSVRFNLPMGRMATSTFSTCIGK